jgi:two-component system sensor histidine kinase RegB
MRMGLTTDALQSGRDVRWLRIDTLSRLRWLALSGQLAAVLATFYVLQFPLPLALCLCVIGVSALLNLAVRWRASKTLRLADGPATALLAFDVLQLATLLYLTGGLENPFAMLFLAPAAIAAVSLPPRRIVLIVVLVLLAASFLSLQHLPLPWYAGQSVSLPLIYRFGFWISLLVACAFICAYAFTVANEARSLSEALTAAELVLARENHLSQIDGLAAAAAHELGTPLATIALVVRELRNSALDAEFSEDLALLTQEAQRCRDILRRLSSLASDPPTLFARTNVSVLLEEVIATHRQAKVRITVEAGGQSDEPLAAHRPAITYGVGNFIENAVDFAKTEVAIKATWTKERVEIHISDDGPGFSSEVLGRIGEPYVTNRIDGIKNADNAGLGLGVFIAKTLLERTGADIKFTNREKGGANVHLKWSRRRFEDRSE